MPQVQVRTLSEDEEFLVQAQETSCGTVLYTGMDSDGDFYIGNTKYSAQSGEQTTFDVPTPTITGEDPNRLSVVFDEIIVKERILVEGGTSGQILSQFDGPVTFSGTVRMNKQLILNNNLRVSGKIDIINSNRAEDATDKNASLRVSGGAAIAKNVIVGEELDVKSNLNVVGISTLVGEVRVDTGIVPDTDEGAYLGTAALPFSGAHIGEIRIADIDDRRIDTVTGNLVLDSANGIVDVNDSLDVGNNAVIRATATSNSASTGALQVINGGAGIAKDLYVGGTIIGAGGLTLTGTASFANNTVTITSNTVTANTFNGTADKSNEIFVNGLGNSSGPHYFLMQQGTAPGGHYTQARVDSGIRYNSASNTLEVAGDIIAFVSDDRLKTDRQPLVGALDKVCSLNGFTFKFNDVAESLGFNTEQTHVGVSAQEVQQVLPEAVHTAPVSEEYITVQYDKIVPLLIEAIKELSDKVSNLEKKLNN